MKIVPISTLIQMAAEKKGSGFATAFNEVMKQKTAEAVSTMQKKVAQEMFNK